MSRRVRVRVKATNAETNPSFGTLFEVSTHSGNSALLGGRSIAEPMAVLSRYTLIVFLVEKPGGIDVVIMVERVFGATAQRLVIDRRGRLRTRDVRICLKRRLGQCANCTRRRMLRDE